MDEFTFDGAKVREENGYTWLHLKLTSEPWNIKAATRYVVETRGLRDAKLTQHREKRSLDANAYAWVLLDRLAEKLGRKKEDVYGDEIRNVGGNTDTVCVPAKAVERLRETWEKRGLGWKTETAESKLPGCTNVVLYYGSSTFDKRQMHRFLDNIIQDCVAVGIETRTPEELAALLGQWGDGI